MKIVLTTLNSKFIHTSLSIRYLKAFVEDIVDVELKEYTINQDINYIASQLFKTNADLIGFSVYIWNLTETLRICEILKKVRPDIKILLGGPEVSFDSKESLETYPFIDYIIYGEGEETFKEFLAAIKDGMLDFQDIKGLAYRRNDQVMVNPPRPLIRDLNTIPSPYNNIGDEFKNKIVYFESSRGCPFNCKFCLSSTIRGVRYFSIDRVKEELDKLIQAKVKQVKFVDRTFNANKKYAMEIMNFIIDKNPEDINFHFEVTAHLLDEEILDFLSNVKEGLFQFEVGVQSTNLKTIEAIGRTTDFPKLREVTKRIKSYKNIHQHLDLIAGLPYEDYGTFKKSFNDVYEIKPEKIQLGFLKLLKGSSLRMNEEKYGFKYLDIPPYEVLENHYIKYEELLKLKSIEELVEKYYNEGYFENSLEYLVMNFYDSPFDFYEDFSLYWEENAYYEVSNSRTRLYEILIEFYECKGFKSLDMFKELIKYDFIKNNKNARLPKGLYNEGKTLGQKEIHNILKDQRILDNYLVQYKDLPTKKTIQNIKIESFSFDILKFIENGYDLEYKLDKIIEENTYILFVYQEGVINRCKSYNITHIVKELS
ncbi:MAG: B12-binding domain-containing radical SAM protein [Tissierellia bacterium]|nr:B12-binding domain-containing radical SAM protein [Tissierellia bacterium]